MYPVVCFSCGRPIGHLWISYFDKLHQSQLKNQSADLDYQTNAKYQALIELGIGDECCRRMFICQIRDIYNKVF